LGAHHLDNRKWATSVKFQAFVLLGLESYDDHISQFLKTDADQEINDVVRQVNVRDLLLYNGLDSLVEFKEAEIQRKAMGYGT
jgi:hypothetical protein